MSVRCTCSFSDRLRLHRLCINHNVAVISAPYSEPVCRAEGEYDVLKQLAGMTTSVRQGWREVALPTWKGPCKSSFSMYQSGKRFVGAAQGEERDSLGAYPWPVHSGCTITSNIDSIHLRSKLSAEDSRSSRAAAPSTRVSSA